MNSTSQHRARRGMTLIEVAAAMTAAMVLIGATVTAAIALQQADRGWSERTNDQRGVAQLIDRLRDDLHAAQTFAWNNEDGSLRLSMQTGGEIVYQRTAKHWERRAADPESAWAYRLPTKVRWRFEPTEGSADELVRVQFYSTQKLPTDEGVQPVLAELAATVGRDARLLVE